MRVHQQRSRPAPCYGLDKTDNSRRCPAAGAPPSTSRSPTVPVPACFFALVHFGGAEGGHKNPAEEI